MPIILNLSSTFRERLGDDVTNEFVGVLNTIDATYVAELRQLNEQNFGRFEAKLEQRIAELRTEFHTSIGDLRTHMDRSLAELRAYVDRSLAELRAHVDGTLADDRAHGDAAMASLRADVAEMIRREAGRLLVWMVGLFVTGFVALTVVMVR